MPIGAISGGILVRIDLAETYAHTDVSRRECGAFSRVIPAAIRICVSTHSLVGSTFVLNAPWRELVVALALSASLASASPPQRGVSPQTHPTLSQLPERTQEILALVAVQSLIYKDVEANLDSYLARANRDSPALDHRFAQTRDQDVLNELEVWLNGVQTQEDLGALVGFLRVKDAQLMIWTKTLIEDFDKNHSQPWGRDSTDWIFRRIRLETRIIASGWDLMLWALVSEVTTDPTQRLPLLWEATALAISNSQ